MDLQREAASVLRWSVRRVARVGGEVLSVSGHEDLVKRLQARFDAVSAVEQARTRFAGKIELALGATFLKRAAVAVGNITEELPGLAEELAPEVTMIAVDKVPNTSAGIKLAEETIEEVWRAPLARLQQRGAVIPMQAGPPAIEQTEAAKN